jgi:hypothetical protein
MRVLLSKGDYHRLGTSTWRLTEPPLNPWSCPSLQCRITLCRKVCVRERNWDEYLVCSLTLQKNVMYISSSLVRGIKGRGSILCYLSYTAERYYVERIRFRWEEFRKEGIRCTYHKYYAVWNIICLRTTKDKTNTWMNEWMVFGFEPFWA